MILNAEEVGLTRQNEDGTSHRQGIHGTQGGLRGLVWLSYRAGRGEEVQRMAA